MKVTGFVRLAGVTTLLVASQASAKGRPFVALENQIIEVQGAISTLQQQVDALVEQVDTIEDRVTANDAAIVSLQYESEQLQVQINEGGETSEALTAQIEALQAQNEALAAQVAAGDTDLQAQITANDALIAGLQQSLSNVATLQEQIDNNTELIEVLQSQTDHIQSVLDEQAAIDEGICPDGTSLVGYSPQTGRRCQPTNGHWPAEVSQLLHHKVTVPRGRSIQVNLSCSLQGGPHKVAQNLGWNQAGGLEILSLQPAGSYYRVVVANPTQMTQAMTFSVECRSPT